MAFSTDDERWPYIAVLVWIATRNFRATISEAARDFKWADSNIASYRVHYPWPGDQRDSLASTKVKLSRALEAGELTGRATRLAREWFIDGREKKGILSQKLTADCAFPPVEERGLLLGLLDAPHPDSEALLYQPLGEGRSHSVDWRGLTFAREDILRLWPEHPQAVAHRLARARPWSPPDDVSESSLVALPVGKRAPLDSVVELLAFGPRGAPAGMQEAESIAERMRAAYALLLAAREEVVALWGTPAIGLSNGRPEASGPRAKIKPAEFDNDALALSHQWESSLGAESVAANFSARGAATEGLLWFGVTVERDSLGRWLAQSGKRTLEAVLKEAANRSGRGVLTQNEAITAAKKGGVFLTREKTVDALKALGIEGKQGRRKIPRNSG